MREALALESKKYCGTIYLGTAPALTRFGTTDQFENLKDISKQNNTSYLTLPSWPVFCQVSNGKISCPIQAGMPKRSVLRPYYIKW